MSGPETTSGNFPYAGFWTRAGARIIDLVLILAAFNVVYLADRLGSDTGMWTGTGFWDGESAGEGFSPANVLRALFFLSFPVFYYVYLHGTYGQTFGKMALKIRVVNEDGSPLDHRKAFLRWLGYFLCDLTFHIGYVWAAFDHRKQGLHDKVCKTLVVRADVPFPAAEAMEPGPPEPPAASPAASLDTPSDRPL